MICWRPFSAWTRAWPRAYLAALASVTAIAGAAAARPGSPPLVGQPLTPFRRPTVQGGRFATDAAAGRVLVIELFAAYCRPCQRRLPALEGLRRELRDALVLGVSLDETREAALAQVRRWRLGFPVIHDAGHVLAGRWRVTELPAAIVVGRDGRISWVGDAASSEGELRQAAQGALRARLGSPRRRMGPAQQMDRPSH